MSTPNINFDLINNFIYMSEIIKVPVYDINNNKIGKISDLVATSRDFYPKITALMIDKKLYPWNKVKTLIKSNMVVMDNRNLENNICLQEGDFLIKETFLDKQVVDISGSKVVRVNDLHLLKEDSNLWLAHIDVGFKGLLRRLGWLRITDNILQWLFSYELKDRFISWKYVQPITKLNILTNPVQLKIPHSKLSELHPADLADILTDLGTDERIIILKSVDTATASRILQELSRKIQISVAESLDRISLAAILNEMPIDETVDLLVELSPKIIHQLMHLMQKEKVVQLKDLLAHSERIAGSIMNPEYIAIPISFTIEQALNKVKELSKKFESIYYTYIIDEKESLVGVITIRQLLTTEPTKLVTEIMKKRVVKVKIDTDKNHVAQLFMKYNFDVIPVVDKQNKIKGIITFKDAIESTYPQLIEQTV